ncbi:MAG: endonuclease/exonuclease/phosphatase family protein [Deltaproteobacteria bacterium]|nr:endonuclease/exonuclease/phosphatase family protein [Deltaproteobacteria bacterium]
MKIHILTINIHKGFSLGNRRFILHQLREAIQTTNADIVFLQEVIGENSSLAAKHHNWPEQAQHEFIADPDWRHFSYSKNAFYPHGHHGNAILSRFPITASEQVNVSTNSFEQRGFLHCILTLPGSRLPLHCLCIHLGLFAISRRKQIRMLAAYAERYIPPEAPLIMAGDFNDWRGQCVVDFALFPGLIDAAVQASGRRALTFPAHLPFLPLDRIYINRLQALKSTTYHNGIWKNLSDHAALFVECEIQ